MRQRLERIRSFLGSPTLTAWLVGLFVLYYLTMAVWLDEAFSRYVGHLSSGVVFRLFFLCFLVNTALRVADHIAHLRGRPARLLLRLPLLLGLVLVLATFFLSLNVRQLQWTQPVGKDDPIVLPWETERFRIIAVEPALAKRALRTDATRIFDFEPAITIVGSDGRPRTIGAFPPRKAGKTYLHVLTFGLGPDIELKKGNEVLGRGFVALRLVPFGSADTFSLAGQPYQFSLSVLPNRMTQKGTETARSYDLDRPRYQLEVVKGDQMIAKEETEGSVSFDGDMTISFFPPSDWVIVEAVRDPFLPWFAFSLLLLACGVLLYPFSFLFGRDRADSSR